MVSYSLADLQMHVQCGTRCKLSTLLLAAHHAYNDLVQILSLAGLVQENLSLAVSADLPVMESERWLLPAFSMAASSSPKI